MQSFKVTKSFSNIPWKVFSQQSILNVDGQEYIVANNDKATRGNKIEAGKTYIVEYVDRERPMFNIEKVNGFVSGHTDKIEDVIWNTVKEVYNALGVKSLRAVEDEVDYEHSVHMHVSSLIDKEVDDSPHGGGWYYLYEGRWSWGSGAGALRLYELKEYNEQDHNEELEAIRKADEKRNLEYKISMAKRSLEQAQNNLDDLQAELTAMQ